jgi:hypothetical protein
MLGVGVVADAEGVTAGSGFPVVTLGPGRAVAGSWGADADGSTDVGATEGAWVETAGRLGSVGMTELGAGALAVGWLASSGSPWLPVSGPAQAKASSGKAQPDL